MGPRSRLFVTVQKVTRIAAGKRPGAKLYYRYALTLAPRKPDPDLDDIIAMASQAQFDLGIEAGCKLLVQVGSGDLHILGVVAEASP